MTSLPPDVDKIWQDEGARARGARKRALLDAIDGLRAAGMVVAAGVRHGLRGELRAAAPGRLVNDDLSLALLEALAPKRKRKTDA